MLYYLQSENGANVIEPNKNYTPIDHMLWAVLPCSASGAITVGRKGCTVLLDNDKSVSRHHATISWSVERNAVLMKESSKYGTFINGEKVETGAEVQIKDNDCIRFGIYHSVFCLKRISFKLCTSRVSVETKKQIDQNLRAISANHSVKWSNAWDETCTHLILDDSGKILVTEKIALAMLHCKPIVNIEFFDKLCTRFKNDSDTKSPVPKESDFVPQSNSADWETILSGSDIARLDDVEDRKNMFSDKIFVFFDKRLYDKNKTIIETAKGNLVDASDMEIDREFFDRYRTAIIVEDANILIPEVKRARLLELGFEFVSGNAVLASILTANRNKYCNPQVPNADSFSQVTARTSMVVPTLIVDSDLEDDTILEGKEHVVEETEEPLSSIVSRLPTQQHSQGAPNLELHDNSQQSQFSHVPTSQSERPVSSLKDRIGETLQKQQQQQHLGSSEHPETNTPPATQQKPGQSPGKQGKLSSGQISPANISTKGYISTTADDKKRIASIMSRRRRREIISSQSQTINISSSEDEDEDDHGAATAIPDTNAREISQHDSLESDTRVDSLRRSSHKFVRSSVKQENQVKRNDDDNGEHVEAFIDVEYVDLATQGSKAGEAASNSPLMRYDSFDSQSRSSPSMFNAKKFRKQRILHSDWKDSQHPQDAEGSYKSMRETITFEVAIANEDDIRRAQDDHADEGNSDSDDSNIDDELISLVMHPKKTRKGATTTGTKRKRTTRASARKPVPVDSDVEDDSDDDFEPEPPRTRSRRRR